MRRRVVDIPLFSQINHSKDYFTILWPSEVNVLSNYWVNKIVIDIALSNKLGSKDSRELLSNFEELFDVELWCRMNDCGKSCIHVLWCPKLRNLCESTFDLITHCRYHIIAWYLAFLVDNSLSPYLSIDFISRF